MDEDPEESLLHAIEVENHPETVEDLLGSINSVPDIKTKEEDKLRQKLRFYYMNPIEKWKYKQRFPYKFFVQLIKIFVVTIQSYLFAHYRSLYVDFMSDNHIAFSHLFLQGWDPGREIISYPPQSGDLAVYKTSDFYSAIDFAVVNYANLDEAIGTYSYAENDDEMAPMEFCLNQYATCDLFSFNNSYIFNNKMIQTCVNLTFTKADASNFSSEAYLRKKNVTVNFSALNTAALTFAVKTINLTPAGPRALPDCYNFNLSVVFDNHEHDGKMKLTLETTAYKLGCNGTVYYQNDKQLMSFLHSLLNSVVIIFCLVSFILCSRAIYRAQILRRKTVAFFKNHYSKDISLNENLDFVNMWYLTMITSDVVIIIGSILKEEIEKNEFSGDEWNICGVMLGTGTFLIWFCVLRYLSFFETYNVVVLTMKMAAPVVFRFLVCTMIIYAGFTFCGWLVLGPYHSKFRTLSITSECLFALINGDDVFGTFSTLQPTKSLLMWWFCRIFLYVFVFLFIYVILSLFVSVILDSYETIKRCYVEGFPKNSIQEFIAGSVFQGLLSDSSSSLANDNLCPNTSCWGS